MCLKIKISGALKIVPKNLWKFLNVLQLYFKQCNKSINTYFDSFCIHIVRKDGKIMKILMFLCVGVVEKFETLKKRLKNNKQTLTTLTKPKLHLLHMCN